MPWASDDGPVRWKRFLSISAIWLALQFIVLLYFMLFYLIWISYTSFLLIFTLNAFIHMYDHTMYSQTRYNWPSNHYAVWPQKAINVWPFYDNIAEERSYVVVRQSNKIWMCMLHERKKIYEDRCAKGMTIMGYIHDGSSLISIFLYSPDGHSEWPVRVKSKVHKSCLAFNHNELHSMNCHRNVLLKVHLHLSAFIFPIWADFTWRANM